MRGMRVDFKFCKYLKLSQQVIKTETNHAWIQDVSLASSVCPVFTKGTFFLLSKHLISALSPSLISPSLSSSLPPYPFIPYFLFSLLPSSFSPSFFPPSLFPSFPPSLPSFLLSCPSVSILPCSPSQICLELVITCLNLPSVEITGASYYYIWLASSRVCVGW